MESTYLSNMVGWEILNKHGELNESNIELNFMMFFFHCHVRFLEGKYIALVEGTYLTINGCSYHVQMMNCLAVRTMTSPELMARKPPKVGLTWLNYVWFEISRILKPKIVPKSGDFMRKPMFSQMLYWWC